MEVNIIAILLATISAFFIGGIWYGPLFGKMWMKENNFSENDLKSRKMARVFGLSFLFALISASLLEMFIGKDSELGFAMFASLSVGLGWVALSMGTTYLFENKTFKLWLVNAGYHIVTFAVMGLILGVIK